MSYADFVAAAGTCRTEAEFRKSPFFQEHGAALEELLQTPRLIGAAAVPKPSSPELRLVHWNIEKGKQLDRIRQRLREEPRLRDADVWCFNEVDDGMARTGNRDVASEIARELGAMGYFLPTYIECTKGLPAEREAPGANRLGLHGLCILTRRPIMDVAVFELPTAWDYFDYSEKRFGGRRALVVRIDAGFGEVDVITTHLEMRAPPCGRTDQVRALLHGFETRSSSPRSVPALAVGDLNTHTFSRGRSGDTLRGFFRIIGTEPNRLSQELLHPASREGLFDEFALGGWHGEGFNDGAPTAWQELGHVEDLRLLPPSVGRLVLKLFRLEGRRLPLRLDWIFGRGLLPFEAATIDSNIPGVGPASDHEPIWARVGPSHSR